MLIWLGKTQAVFVPDDAVASRSVPKTRKTKADLCMEKIAAHDGLNAVGKPYGANYDPNYKMKYRPRKYAPSKPPLSSDRLTSC